ncbi:hypothetical protein FACS1894159_01230 [Bacteroidia bacterium]|nr:hypothetical protein FACS1894159_01230 [Bacteroidia bacterium]
MKQTLKTVLQVALVALLCSCSKYSKLLNSKDHNAQYKKSLELFTAEKYNKALQLFEECNPYFLGTIREDSSAYYLATCNYKLGYFDTSSELFEDFRRRFARSPFIEEAEYMYAMGYYYSAPEPYRDQTYTSKAIAAINEYLARYPKSVKREKLEGYLGELTQKLYDKTYLNAYTYYKIGKYKSAAVSLKNAAVKYPESNHREELLFLAAKSSYLLAHKSIEKLQRDRYLNAMDDYYTFVSEYPQSKYRKELDQLQERSKKFIASHPYSTATEDKTQQPKP